MEKARQEAWLRVAAEGRAELPRLADDFRFKWKRFRRGAILTHMAGNHLTCGLCAYLFQGDMPQLKQHLHVASKLRAASVNQDGGETFQIDRQFLFAMLSDSPEIIKTFANLEPAEYLADRDKPRQPRFYVHMLQLALRDDHEALREKIAIAAKSAGKQYREEFASGRDLYSLLLARDQAGLEERLARKARIKSVDPWIEDFIAGSAMTEAKLCWLKGIPVQIDNPLIPMELLPVQPLQQYDDVYDFLQPGWKPPLQGALGRLWARMRR